MRRAWREYRASLAWRLPACPLPRPPRWPACRAFPILGPGQRNLPVSLTFANLPLYTGGRLRRNIDAASAQVVAQRTEEFRTALDLKLTVAEAYIGVLRAQRNLEVARTNVARLSSFARDVRNRREQGLAIRSDELAAEVSLANARLAQIQARTTLEAAWATYNRYLCRPLTETTTLEELTTLPANADWKALADQAIDANSETTKTNESEVQSLTRQALLARPELAGLVQQARAWRPRPKRRGQASGPRWASSSHSVIWATTTRSRRASARPCSTPTGRSPTAEPAPPGRRAAATGSGHDEATSRRRGVSRARVRTRWLDLHQAQLRVPVARLAIAQAEENIAVVTDRYRQERARTPKFSTPKIAAYSPLTISTTPSTTRAWPSFDCIAPWATSESPARCRIDEHIPSSEPAVALRCGDCMRTVGRWLLDDLDILLHLGDVHLNFVNLLEELGTLAEC